MPSTSRDLPAPLGRASRFLRRGGMLVLLGFLAFGAMFVSFGITDTDPFEILGGTGFILAGVGAWLITTGIAERWNS